MFLIFKFSKLLEIEDLNLPNKFASLSSFERMIALLLILFDTFKLSPTGLASLSTICSTNFLIEMFLSVLSELK